jgi:hypothetical protein
VRFRAPLNRSIKKPLLKKASDKGSVSNFKSRFDIAVYSKEALKQKA